MMTTLCAIAVLLAQLCAVAHGHATLNFPRSRNYIARFMVNPPEHYCPHCGQGNGGVPGICGDPYQAGYPESKVPTFDFFRDKGYYGIRTHDLVEGQIIETEIELDTNHGGRMSFAVCPLPAAQATQECFSRPEHRLRRIDNNPLYDNKLYYYLKENDTVVRTRWRLPPGITCPDGCLFQWWWLGYQSCWVECESPEDDVPGECDFNPLNPSVVSCPNGILSTEQYKNCADIRILPAPNSGDGGSTAQSVTLTTSTDGGAGGTGNGGDNSGTAGVSGGGSTTAEVPPPASDTPSTPVPSPSPSPSQASADPKPSTIPETTPLNDSTSNSSPGPDTLSRPPSPAKKPPTPISPAGSAFDTCPDGASPWACQTCDNLTTSSEYKGLRGHCYKCVGANPDDPYSCEECFRSANPLQPAVVAGCLSCAGDRQLPGWSCRKQCAEFAPDAGAVQECAQCLATAPDAWGCAVCMSVAGLDPQARAACMKCAQRGVNNYACGACAAKRTAEAQQACYTCLDGLPKRDTSPTCLQN